MEISLKNHVFSLNLGYRTNQGLKQLPVFSNILAALERLCGWLHWGFNWSSLQSPTFPLLSFQVVSCCLAQQKKPGVCRDSAFKKTMNSLKERRKNLQTVEHIRFAFVTDHVHVGRCSNLLKVDFHDLEASPSTPSTNCFSVVADRNHVACTSGTKACKCQRFWALVELSWQAQLQQKLCEARPQSCS